MIKEVKCYEQNNPRKIVLFLDGERFATGCRITDFHISDQKWIDVTTPMDTEFKYYKCKEAICVKIKYKGKDNIEHLEEVKISHDCAMINPTCEDIDGNIDNEILEVF